jgi:hypothetical protein
MRTTRIGRTFQVSPLPSAHLLCLQHFAIVCLSELLDYDLLTKSDKMLPQGWSTDTTGKLDSRDGNIGWFRRRNLFLESSSSTEEVFTRTPVPLVGALITDFQSFSNGKAIFYTAAVT